MSFNYGALADTAASMLSSFGTTATFTRKISIGFDPVLGYDTNEDTTWTASVVKSNYMSAEINGDLILVNDIKLICESLTTVPTAGDTATVNGIVYRVISVSRVSPSGTDVIYKIQVRK